MLMAPVRHPLMQYFSQRIAHISFCASATSDDYHFLPFDLSCAALDQPATNTQCLLHSSSEAAPVLVQSPV